MSLRLEKSHIFPTGVHFTHAEPYFRRAGVNDKNFEDFANRAERIAKAIKKTHGPSFGGDLRIVEISAVAAMLDHYIVLKLNAGELDTKTRHAAFALHYLLATDPDEINFNALAESLPREVAAKARIPLFGYCGCGRLGEIHEFMKAIERSWNNHRMSVFVDTAENKLTEQPKAITTELATTVGTAEHDPSLQFFQGACAAGLLGCEDLNDTASELLKTVKVELTDFVADGPKK